MNHPRSFDASNYSYGPGVDLSLESGVNFHFFAVGMHHHFWNNEPCSVHFAIMVTVMGIRVSIGLFKYYH